MAVNELTVTNDVTKNRSEYIGGSDIAAIMGLSRWKTPLKLWCEKTSKIPVEDLSTNEAVEMGTRLEQFVADLWAVKNDKSVRRAPKAYQHPDYPYMVAHVDRLVTGTDELLECKTCSAFKKEEWDGDEIPQEYVLQLMWYLGITGRKIGHIAVLIGGQNFKYKKIEFDQEMFESMINAAKDFWQKVQNDIPPAVMANDDETLKDLYSDHSEVMIDLFPTNDESAAAVTAFEDKVAYLQETKAHIKNLQDEQKELETEIKNIIQDNLGIKTPKYVITWKNQTKSGLDTKLLKAEHPELAEKYTTSSTYRVMRIANNKENEVA